MNSAFSGNPTENAQCNHYNEFGANPSPRPVMSIAIPLSPELQNLTQSLLPSPPSSSSQQESEDEVTSTPVEAIENKIIVPISATGPIMAPYDASVSCQMRRVCQEKGKGKAFFNGYEQERFSNDRGENVESQNSTLFRSSGAKRLRNEQSGRSKKAKMHIQENRSSFMNWISNIVKGRSVCDTKMEFSPDNTCGKNLHGPDMGFGVVFRSLYRQDTKKTNSALCKDGSTSHKREAPPPLDAEEHKYRPSSFSSYSSCNETHSDAKKTMPNEPWASENSNQLVPSLRISQLYSKKTSVEEGTIDKKTKISEARHDPVHGILRSTGKEPVKGSTSLETSTATSMLAKRMDA